VLLDFEIYIESDDGGFKHCTILDAPNLDPNLVIEDDINIYGARHYWVATKLPKKDMAPNEVHINPYIVQEKRKVQRKRVDNSALMLDDSLESEDAYDGNESSDGGDPNNSDGVKHRFRNSTWSQSNFTFSLPPKTFVGARGPIRGFRTMPTFMQLFSLFCIYNLLQKIVVESN